MDVHPSDFVTVALLVLLEGLLSADNALVLAILMRRTLTADRRGGRCPSDERSQRS